MLQKPPLKSHGIFAKGFLICYSFHMNFLKVLKSFDIFNSEAIRFLANRALNIFSIETNNSKYSGVSVETDKNGININIINRPKTYNLLVCAQKRIEEKRAKLAGKL